MKFLVKEVLKSFSTYSTHKKIGFIVPSVGFYSKVDASTRIRVYDIIETFRNNREFHLELYRNHRYYDIVIFLKTYNASAQTLAIKLQQQGTRIVFDININIFEKGSNFVTTKQLEEGIAFANISDAIITNSPHTLSILRQRFTEKVTYMINETLSNNYFRIREINDSDSLTLIWIGYAHKAAALLQIKNVLEELHQNTPLIVIIVAEKEPDLSLLTVPIEFRAYQHNRIPEHLAQADIFIAPRDLTDTYNLGHSFTKIGVAMAAGIPVVASPVPSYLDSPAICCSSKEEWIRAITKLYTDRTFRESLIVRGKKYCSDHYSLESVQSDYLNLFRRISA
ncbi:MAG: glycosyltransferase [Cytophagales bacterium]|nr:glycosyltransferase [Cytophagales bacterium]